MRTMGVTQIQTILIMFSFDKSFLDLSGNHTARYLSIQISTTIADEHIVAGKRIAHDILQPTVVIALISIPTMACRQGCVRAHDRHEIISQIASELSSTLCASDLQGNLDMLLSNKAFPHNPRAVKKQLRPNNVYVSPVTGMLPVARSCVEVFWSKYEAGVV